MIGMLGVGEAVSHILRHNPNTYSRYTQREREERDGIDIIPSNDEADSVAGNIFFHIHIPTRTPPLLVFAFYIRPTTPSLDNRIAT
jgi:hypothetical protein